ncbi:AI-2E family transporter [Sphingomonas astaxanthinifaciens]|uniref:AI-2E family transporter n=1 Tax=Sphingomonas astaxanthinifaciens DSM 22298 TaxID=1123267 RepID=A0ABQ5Z788_9SPHN|nr:AI-2E family transporter [Sphingomonas astaxanthinifaciens]GLR48643.1 AI-2E family transporter [Sphingomonas astaxanthinifaciens DSM 22298]
MDASQPRTDSPEDDAALLAEQITVKRDRLLASLTLIAGIGLIFALPFALRAGAEFFLPVTAAIVIAIALVPLLQWFERRGLPAALSALSCVLVFLAVTAFALLSIVIPATDWVMLLPQRIGRVKEALGPLLKIYEDLQRFADRIIKQLPSGDSAGGGQTVKLETPNSISDLLTNSAPHALIQMFFALLLIYFFLAGWTAMRKSTITSRGSFEGALTTARVIQQTVTATSTYIGTISLINVTLGALLALIVWAVGMDSPLMWGGIVAVLNFIPYLGPIAAAALLALGGLISFGGPETWKAFLPPLIFIGMHLVEANAVTPLIVGKRVKINPILILLSLSFWAWVWGTVGALLAIPLLIIFKTVFAAAGTPDIAGFLFEHGTLTHAGEEDEYEATERPPALSAAPRDRQMP